MNGDEALEPTSALRSAAPDGDFNGKESLLRPKRLSGAEIGRPLGYATPPGSRTEYVGSEWHDDPLYRAITDFVAQSTTVHEQLSALTSEDLAGTTDRIVAAALLGDEIRPIELVDLDARPEGAEPLEGEPLYLDDGQRVGCKRLFFGWRVSGRVQWLECWPWKAADPPLDPAVVADSQSRRSLHGGVANESPFSIEVIGSPERREGIVHTYTEFFDDEIEDEDAFRRLRDLRLHQRAEYLQEFISAHGQAVSVCYEHILAELEQHVGRRRRDLRFTAIVGEGIDFPLEPIGAIELEDGSTQSDEMEFYRVLTESTFGNIISVLNRWRHTVMSGTRYLCELGEDGLTFTLLPTLEAAFGVAMHDAFVFLGHADIVIPAQQLAELQGVVVTEDHPALFVAEAKKDPSAVITVEAVDQLSDYLPRIYRHGCLIYYVTDDDGDGVEDAILDSLRAHPDFFDGGERVSTVPVLRFKDKARHGVRDVAVLVVSLPRVISRRDEDAKRRQVRSLADG